MGQGWDLKAHLTPESTLALEPPSQLCSQLEGKEGLAMTLGEPAGTALLPQRYHLFLGPLCLSVEDDSATFQ